LTPSGVVVQRQPAAAFHPIPANKKPPHRRTGTGASDWGKGETPSRCM